MQALVCQTGQGCRKQTQDKRPTGQEQAQIDAERYKGQQVLHHLAVIGLAVDAQRVAQGDEVHCAQVRQVTRGQGELKQDNPGQHDEVKDEQDDRPAVGLCMEHERQRLLAAFGMGMLLR